MKKRLMTFGFSILISLSLATAAVTSVAAAGSPAAQSSIAASPSSEVVDQINLIRVEHGLKPLVVNLKLAASAQAYAAALGNGNFFAHVGLDGSTLVTRDVRAGYTHWTYLEENLAAGQPTATAAVNAWMNSPAHRADILSPKVTETGVGYVFVPGSYYGYYWVEEFGARSVK